MFRMANTMYTKFYKGVRDVDTVNNHLTDARLDTISKKEE